MFVGDEDGRVRLAPVGLEVAEVHLQHHHAQHGAVGVVDASGQVQAGFVADGAQREMLGRTVRHGAAEVGPELVVDADERRGLAPIAGGDGVAALVQHIDGRGADAVTQGIELFVQRFDQGRGGVLQGGAQVYVAGQDEGQRAEFVQVVAQQGGVDLAGAAGLEIGLFERAFTRPFAGGVQHAEDDRHRRQDQQCPVPGRAAPERGGARVRLLRGGRLWGGRTGRHGLCGFSHILSVFCVIFRQCFRRGAIAADGNHH